MPTTTNYGWTTPADTDLVKDGASAIRTLGTAIDTTVFNNASAAIAKSIVDAKGDLIVATAADTVARLASSATNGDLLTVDTSTASGLKWAAPVTPSVQVAVFQDARESGVSGTFTSGAWRTRTLQTSQFNNITGASLSSNQITLPAGTFIVIATAGAYKVGEHQLRFYNITDSSETIVGLNQFNDTNTNIAATAPLEGAFTIAGSKVFELQHQCNTTRSEDGFGNQSPFSSEVYANVAIWKVG